MGFPIPLSHSWRKLLQAIGDEISIFLTLGFDVPAKRGIACCIAKVQDRNVGKSGMMKCSLRTQQQLQMS